jgi:hypothetical protein
MVHSAGPLHRDGPFYRGGGARYRLHVDLLRVSSARCRRF